jgi:hypothetical protein
MLLAEVLETLRDDHTAELTPKSTRLAAPDRYAYSGSQAARPDRRRRDSAYASASASSARASRHNAYRSRVTRFSAAVTSFSAACWRTVSSIR